MKKWGPEKKNLLAWILWIIFLPVFFTEKITGEEFKSDDIFLDWRWFLGYLAIMVSVVLFVLFIAGGFWLWHYSYYFRLLSMGILGWYAHYFFHILRKANLL